MRHREPDPATELFDVVDRLGRPTGIVKPRSSVHQDGDWHRAFHLWVALRNPADSDVSLIFQRRSGQKDTYPHLLDVTVGGHYRAGEGFDEVVREIQEEIGLEPPREALVPIGRRWAEGITEQWIDREIEDVFVFELDRPVDQLRPSCEEITAIDIIPVDSLKRLLLGEAITIEANRYCVNSRNTLGPVERAVVRASDFIPVSDGYWIAAANAASAVLRGEPDVELILPGPGATTRS